MPSLRIPIIASVDPESIEDSYLQSAQSSKNAMFDKYPEGRGYVTQRPGIHITSTAEDTDRPLRARGAYNWEKLNRTFQVVDNIVYADYSAEIGTISPGRNLVSFIETDESLVIIDPVNNEGWLITSSLELKQITDDNFPPNQSPPRTLAGGGVWLEGNLYVLDLEGFIWNSVDNDPSEWDALGFIEAGRHEDKGIYLAPHASGIAAIGSQSIEFFYNAGNPNASPLRKRQDVHHNVGALDYQSVTVNGDSIFFVGSTPQGTIGAFSLAGYKVSKVSTKSVDDMLAAARHTKNVDFLLAGMNIRGHDMLFITGLSSASVGDYFEDADYMVSADDYVLSDGTDLYTAQFTLVLDYTIGYWTEYDCPLLTYGKFPVITGTSKLAQKSPIASVMFINGEVAQFAADFAPIDKKIYGPYFEPLDYVENQDDYIENDNVTLSEAIYMKTVMPEYDADTMALKFGHKLELVGHTTSDGSSGFPISVSWSDDHYKTFSTPRQLTTDFRQKLTRLGKFKRRAHVVEYSGIDRLRIEGIDLYLRASRYAT